MARETGGRTVAPLLRSCGAADGCCCSDLVHRVSSEIEDEQRVRTVLHLACFLARPLAARLSRLAHSGPGRATAAGGTAQPAAAGRAGTLLQGALRACALCCACVPLMHCASEGACACGRAEAACVCLACCVRDCWLTGGLRAQALEAVTLVKEQLAEAEQAASSRVRTRRRALCQVGRHTARLSRLPDCAHSSCRAAQLSPDAVARTAAEDRLRHFRKQVCRRPASSITRRRTLLRTGVRKSARAAPRPDRRALHSRRYKQLITALVPALPSLKRARLQTSSGSRTRPRPSRATRSGGGTCCGRARRRCAGALARSTSSQVRPALHMHASWPSDAHKRARVHRASAKALSHGAMEAQRRSGYGLKQACARRWARTCRRCVAWCALQALHLSALCMMCSARRHALPVCLSICVVMRA